MHPQMPKARETRMPQPRATRRDHGDPDAAGPGNPDAELDAAIVQLRTAMMGAITELDRFNQTVRAVRERLAELTSPPSPPK